jgi:hypothetical protein
MFRSVSDGAIRSEEASNFHSGTGALGGFVQHVFRLPAHSRLPTLKLQCAAANLKTLSIMALRHCACATDMVAISAANTDQTPPINLPS